MASLIVLNWQAEETTARCVASLRELEGAEDCELVLVDNESTASSRRALSLLGNARVVPLPANQGFAGGMNAGIAAARGKFVALFNNDLVVHPEWLREGLRVLQDTAVGIVGGAALPWELNGPFTGGPITGGPVSAGEPLAMVGVDPERGFAVLGPAPGDERVVAGVDGSNVLARAELMHQLGGFDPDYFAYGEDVDLCARAYALGYATVFDPMMRVWHRRGTSGDRVPRKRAFWAARNQVITVAKHFPEGSWRRAAALVVLEHLSDALLGHRGGLRARGAKALSVEERLGRAHAAGWVVLNARTLAAKRAQAVAAGQHDEGYTARLASLYAAAGRRSAK